MLDSLNFIGKKIGRLFGEPSLGFASISKKQEKKSKEIFNLEPLSKILPFEAFDQETGLFYSENSLGFVIEAIPVVGIDETIEKEIASLFEEILEEEASIQCLLFADHRISDFFDTWEKGRGEGENTISELVKKRSAYYKSKEAVSTRVFRFILSYSIPYSESSHKKEAVSLTEKRKALLKTFDHFTYAFSWKADHFLNVVGSLIHFDLSKETPHRSWNPFESLSSQIVSGGTLEVSDEYLQWNTETESFFKSFRVTNLPDYWPLQAMHLLIGDSFRDAYRINDPFYLHFGVHCPKQPKVENAFWRKSQLIENQGKSGMLLRLIPELEHELHECHRIRQEAKRGAKFVWTQFSAGIWSTKERFVQSCQLLKSLFRIHQFQAVENTAIHLPQLLSILPLAWGEYVKDLKDLSLLRTTLSTECKHFVPIQGEWMGTPTPGMILIGRRGQLLNWNPFDNQSGNYNIAISGRSGSGKSVFMQDLLLTGLSFGAKVFVLDVGRSFEKLCDLLEGQKIEFSGDVNLCLNPFTTIAIDEKEAAFSFLKAIIGCMAAPTSGVSDYQNAWIEKAISYAWEKKKQKATISDVASWLSLQDDKTPKELGVVLIPFTKDGIYARYFEGENNINFNNPMVLIELEELKDKKDLQAVVLQLFIMAITNHAFLGDRKTPFFICIDEAWDLLRSKQTGLFIETLARRLRKYHGSLVVGTQSIEDFYATSGAQAAYQNSDWTCFLSQKKSSIAALSRDGKLEVDGKTKALESVSTRHGEFSEVMIVDGNSNFSIARLILDPFSKLLYSTKASDHYAISSLRAKGMSVSEAINHLLEKKHVES